MDVAVTRGSQLLPCNASSSFCGSSSYRTLVELTKSSWAAKGVRSSLSYLRTVVVRAEQRPTWLPGLDPPPYLDATLAGDFGFDPLGLGEDPERLKRYVQAELVHSGFAMAGVVGILLTDKPRDIWISKILDLKPKRDLSFGLEAALEGLKPGYPSGPLLNPMGLAKDIKNAHEWKLKQIKNG